MSVKSLLDGIPELQYTDVKTKIQLDKKFLQYEILQTYFFRFY